MENTVVYYLSYKRHRDDPPHLYEWVKWLTLLNLLSRMYTVTMPKGTVVIRHNRKVSIQGNCDLSQVELRSIYLSGDENMQMPISQGVTCTVRLLHFVW